MLSHVSTFYSEDLNVQKTKWILNIVLCLEEKWKEKLHYFPQRLRFFAKYFHKLAKQMYTLVFLLKSPMFKVFMSLLKYLNIKI